MKKLIEEYGEAALYIACGSLITGFLAAALAVLSRA